MTFAHILVLSLLVACGTDQGPDLPPAPPALLEAGELFRAHPTLDAPTKAQLGDPPRPNILLVVIESLDAGTVQALREDPEPAPTLARLMREGVSFEQAYTQGGWTLPGLGALLTGRYPRLSHEGSAAGAVGAPGVRTLPELLGLYGYATAAIWGGTLACSFADGLPFHHSSPVRCGASRVPFEQALGEWVEGYAQQPWFVLLHNIDLHTPEPAAPEAWLHRYTEPHPACLGTGTGFVYAQIESEMGVRAAAEHVIGHYRGQLAYYDQALERMLAGLEQAGQLEDTVVIVTTNHGQDLFEHACFDHGALYDTILHVPLIWWDSSVQSGRVDTVVQSIDLVPSILDRVGVPWASLDGRSLAPLLGLAGGAYEPQDVYSLSKGATASLRTPQLKLILGQGPRSVECPAVRTPQPAPKPKPHYELYDLVADPGERVDIYEERAAEVVPMVQALEAWLEERRPGEDDPLPPIPEHQRRALQDKGYWELAKPEQSPPRPPPRRPPPPRERNAEKARPPR